MKKLLLSLLILLGFNANSQTTLFLDDFEDGAITNWTLIDSDGDTFNWVAVNMTAAPIYKGMRSASWITSGALTPDNWAITPAIDLGFGGEQLTLTWDVVARDADWDLENYNVYVSNTNTTAGMLATLPVYEETTLEGVNVMTSRSVVLPADLSGTIYVAFRHFGVTDQFTVDVDNVKLVSAPLKTDTFFTQNFKVYPNPATTVVNLSSKNNTTINQVQITDLNGRVIKSIAVNEVVTQINIADLNAGVYFLKATSNNGVGVTKIVKK